MSAGRFLVMIRIARFKGQEAEGITTYVAGGRRALGRERERLKQASSPLPRLSRQRKQGLFWFLCFVREDTATGGQSSVAEGHASLAVLDALPVFASLVAICVKVGRCEYHGSLTMLFAFS